MAHFSLGTVASPVGAGSKGRRHWLRAVTISRFHSFGQWDDGSRSCRKPRISRDRNRLLTLSTLFLSSNESRQSPSIVYHGNLSRGAAGSGAGRLGQLVQRKESRRLGRAQRQGEKNR